MNHRLTILKNETDDAHLMWVAACQKKKIAFTVVDMSRQEWMDAVIKNQADYYLAVPSGTVSYFKTMYDERLYVLDKVLGLPVYPGFDEIVFHENKRMLSYWLKAHNLPHPQTNVFYQKDDALSFLTSTAFPVVAKTNIGASGRGVKILENKTVAMDYLNNALSGSGIRQQTGPNLKMGRIFSRLAYSLKNPDHIYKRIKIYHKIREDVQKYFVIFQEFIPHDFEWRIVRIGRSFFGYKKKKTGDQCSGRKGYIYDSPPADLLDFVKFICEKYQFNCMAVDLFEDGSGGYLINEMQTVFGHVRDHICERDGHPGRLIYKDNAWKFEKGYFNKNLSYDLRLENVLELLDSSK